MKIVTICCDRYADTAPAFVELLAKNWPDHKSVVFVTNSKPLAVTEPVVYLSERKDMAFGWRLRRFIRHHYTDEHLLFMMSDYFVKDVKPELITIAHELCATERVRHVRLRPMPHPQFIYDVDGFGMIDKKQRYSLSLQPGIWETRVLYDLCRDNENPWATEINGSLRARDITGVFLSTTEHAISHHNYYRKGRPQGVGWVRDNVNPEAWPEAVRRGK